MTRATLPERPAPQSALPALTDLLRQALDGLLPTGFALETLLDRVEARR
jgi:hypothetical protein